MRVDLDESGALYVHLAPEGQEDHIRAEHTVDLGAGVLVDLGADGRPVGVEVLPARPQPEKQ